MVETAAISKVVYIQGMGFKTTEEDMVQFFSRFGTVTRVRIIFDDHKRPKGTGYIAFEDHEMALNATKRDELFFKGKYCYVDLNRSKKMEERMTVLPKGNDYSPVVGPPDPKPLFVEEETVEVKTADFSENSIEEEKEKNQNRHHRHRHHHRHHKGSGSESEKYYYDLPE